MSLEAVLEAIETSGQEEIDEIKAQSQEEVEEILAAAREEAHVIQEQERQKALRTARRKRAHLLHEASSRQLQIRQEGREHIIEEILEGTRQRLQQFRSESQYGEVLGRLIEEAFDALGSSLADGEKPIVEVDPRDRDRIEDMVQDLPREVDFEEGAESWGGLIVTSQDGRVRVSNTLDSRMRRATPYLHISLAARFGNND